MPKVSYRVGNKLKSEDDAGKKLFILPASRIHREPLKQLSKDKKRLVDLFKHFRHVSRQK
jgi:hypothetical protein